MFKKRITQTAVFDLKSLIELRCKDIPSISSRRDAGETVLCSECRIFKEKGRGREKYEI